MMGRVKTLLEVVTDLASADEDAAIYAVEPWTCETPAVVAAEPLTGGVPDIAANAGMTYLLAISVAREFLEGWDPDDSPRARCERLIGYAINDA